MPLRCLRSPLSSHRSSTSRSSFVCRPSAAWCQAWSIDRECSVVNIVYVTSRYPFGPGEAFLGPEIVAHIDSGWDVAVFPAIRKGRLIHTDAGAVVARTAVPSRFAVARDFVRFVLGAPAGRRAWLSMVS